MNILKRIVSDLTNWPLVREYNITKAKLKMARRVKEGKSENDAMKPGYNKVRAIARWKQAIKDIPVLEEKKVKLETKLRERNLL